MRPWFFVALLAFGTYLMIAAVKSPPQQELRPSFKRVFEVIGGATDVVDGALTRLIPVDSIDEREMGEALQAQLSQDPTLSFAPYGNNLMKTLSQHSSKPFSYRVYLSSQSLPNACALPGGIIIVTTGLRDILHSESELAAVLLHEMGHIELGHCMSAVKYQLLANKVGALPIGKIADLAYRFSLGTSFSKTQESQADAFAYEALLSTDYDPRGLGNAFQALSQKTGAPNSHSQPPSIFNDYFATHPDIAIRTAQYQQQAQQWWKKNQDVRKYVGIENLKYRQNYPSTTSSTEWVTQ